MKLQATMIQQIRMKESTVQWKSWVTAGGRSMARWPCCATFQPGSPEALRPGSPYTDGGAPPSDSRFLRANMPPSPSTPEFMPGMPCKSQTQLPVGRITVPVRRSICLVADASSAVRSKHVSYAEAGCHLSILHLFDCQILRVFDTARSATVWKNTTHTQKRTLQDKPLPLKSKASGRPA